MQLRQAPMVLVAAALATSAQAEPEVARTVAQNTPVAFEIKVCLASKAEGEVDPECRSMQSRLPDRYGTLKLQKRQTVTVSFGEPGGIDLPTGSTVEFRPISIVDNQLHMQLEIPGAVNTRLRLQSGTPVILAGEKHSGGYLVIEVRPTFTAPPIVAEQTPRRPTPPPSVEKAGARSTR